MRYRHRMPALFGLSTMDVLCGGLGAMLLLMLLNHWDAQRSGAALETAEQRGGELRAQLADTRMETERLQAALTEAAAEQEELRNSRDRLAETRTRELQIASETKERLRAVEAELKAANALLEQTRADRLALEKQLATATGERQVAQERVGNLEKQVQEASTRLQALAGQLRMSEQDKVAAEAVAADLTKLRTELAEARQRADALEQDVARWRKEAEAAGVKVNAAEESSKQALLDAATLRRLLDDQQASAGRLRAELQEAANRFAGVDLAGERVVLVIDKSGSMASVEPGKAAPDKWPALARTVALVLRSLKGLRQYQVIVFSDRAEYLLGQPGQWLDYTKDSPLEVEKALLATEPRGNTNLYAAFEAAFRMKSQGLDAIYLFSDGLPNVGPGLPPNPPPDEPSQAAILGKHLRDTLRTRWNAGEPKVLIHSIGFFYDSPNLGAFLWALSRENGGSFVGMSRP